MRALRRVPPASAPDDDRLSYLQVLILLLLRGRGPLPGVAMLRALAAADYRSSPGSLYKAMHQLREMGLASQSMGPIRDIPGGRAMMMFSITGRGEEALGRTLALIGSLT